MTEIGPAILAIIATIGGLLASLVAARALRRLGLGDAQLQVNKTLRELADAKAAETDIWKARYEAEVAAHVSTVAERDRYRRESDDCDRRLSNVYSELRATGRLADRRSTPREGGPA